MNNIKNMPTSAFIRSELKSGRVCLPPIAFILTETKPVMVGKYRFDGLIQATWGENTIAFIGEIKTSSTPKEFMAGIALFKAVTLPEDRYPLLITPFLSPEQLQALEQEGINGVDLCGNGVINDVRKITVVRTGQPNRFASYQPIKNIYRRNSSLVGRVLFSIPRFPGVTPIVDEIVRRDCVSTAMGLPNLAQGTVSKVLAGLDDDLIINRGPDGIVLLQPDWLLEKLVRNFVELPRVSVTLKVNIATNGLPGLLANASRLIKIPVAATGLSSVGRYAVMEREEKLAVYCPDTEALVKQLAPVSVATDRFPNLEIFATCDTAVYFDAIEDDGFFWASAVQTYLELMAGDKRDQETATVIREKLIRAVEGNQ